MEEIQELEAGTSAMIRMGQKCQQMAKECGGSFGDGKLQRENLGE